MSDTSDSKLAGKSFKKTWDKVITQLIEEGLIKKSEINEVSVEEKNIALQKIDAILKCLKPEVPERKE